MCPHYRQLPQAAYNRPTLVTRPTNQMSLLLISRYTINFESNDKVPLHAYWEHNHARLMAPHELTLINPSPPSCTALVTLALKKQKALLKGSQYFALYT